MPKVAVVREVEVVAAVQEVAEVVPVAEEPVAVPVAEEPVAVPVAEEPVAVPVVVREQALPAQEVAVVLAVIMPLLPSMPKRFAPFCTALRPSALLRRRITRS